MDFQKILTALATAASIGAMTAIFFMWNSINTMLAQQPLRDELMEGKLEDIKQTIQINGQQISINELEIEMLEDRIRYLEINR